MTPDTLLSHYDSGMLWPTADAAADGDVAFAYQRALAVRALRSARGEVPRGYKIGFTNRNIWAHYNVYGPVWGTVWSTTLSFCNGDGRISLDRCAQPRIEPEAVFGLRATPTPGGSLDDLFDAVDWVAPGFEIVQSHLPDWKFTAVQTVADSALHARLLVGTQRPVREFADSAAALDRQLCGARVTLLRGEEQVEQGMGSNVLDGPLSALHHFLKELHSCPGAPTLQPGDVVTTGTWTNAWPVQAGERWIADFDAPLSRLSVAFS